MTSAQDRPTKGDRPNGSKASADPKNGGSLAYYLDAAPASADPEEVYRAWQRGVLPVGWGDPDD